MTQNSSTTAKISDEAGSRNTARRVVGPSAAAPVGSRSAPSAGSPPRVGTAGSVGSAGRAAAARSVGSPLLVTRPWWHGGPLAPGPSGRDRKRCAKMLASHPSPWEGDPAELTLRKSRAYHRAHAFASSRNPVARRSRNPRSGAQPLGHPVTVTRGFLLLCSHFRSTEQHSSRAAPVPTVEQYRQTGMT
jgi:hypothetical protein